MPGLEERFGVDDAVPLVRVLTAEVGVVGFGTVRRATGTVAGAGAAVVAGFPGLVRVRTAAAGTAPVVGAVGALGVTGAAAAVLAIFAGLVRVRGTAAVATGVLALVTCRVAGVPVCAERRTFAAGWGLSLGARSRRTT